VIKNEWSYISTPPYASMECSGKEIYLIDMCVYVCVYVSDFSNETSSFILTNTRTNLTPMDGTPKPLFLISYSLQKKFRYRSAYRSTNFGALKLCIMQVCIKLCIYVWVYVWVCMVTQQVKKSSSMSNIKVIRLSCNRPHFHVLCEFRLKFLIHLSFPHACYTFILP
jgi:hypothetical protein